MLFSCSHDSFFKNSQILFGSLTLKAFVGSMLVPLRLHISVLMLMYHGISLRTSLLTDFVDKDFLGGVVNIKRGVYYLLDSKGSISFPLTIKSIFANPI